MPRVRTPITTTLTIGGSAVDVSADVVVFRVENGTKDSNADRPAVASARGLLRLVGDRYAPGVSSVYTVAELSARLRCQVSQGAVMLWDGWAERPNVEPRAAGFHLTGFDLVGKSDDRLAERLEYANSSGWPSDADWSDIVGQTPRLLGAAALETVWAPYSFDGRTGEYLGKVAQVVGRLPGEDRLGRLGMATYRRLPDAQVAVSAHALLIREAVSETVSDVRNIIDFPFDPVAGNTMMAGAEGRVVVSSGTLGASRQVTIAIPQPDNPNTTFTDFSVALLAANVVALRKCWVYLRGTDPIRAFFQYESVDQSTRSPDPTVQLINISRHVSVSHTVQGGQYIVTFSVSDFSETVNWELDQYRAGDTGFLGVVARRGRAIGRGSTIGLLAGGTRLNTRADGSFFGHIADQINRVIQNVQLVARLSYTVTSTALTAVDLQNPDSRAAWGDRELEFPLWVAHAALQTGQATRTRIQADLDFLAEPRTYHEIELPLWQETAAKNGIVGALDFGSYLDLGLRDTSRGVDISAKVVVTQRILTYGQTIVPAVRLRCLETGEPGTAPVSRTPGAPTGLTVGTTTSSTIPISWTAPASGGSVSEYRIEWGTGGSYSLGSAETSGTSHTIPNLSPGTTYNIRVRAQNSDGNSTWVTGTGATMAAVPAAAPGPPRNVATSGVTHEAVTVGWAAPNTGGHPVSYSVRYRRDGTTAWAQTITGITGTSRTLTGLTASTALEIEVQAVNSHGTSTWVRVDVSTTAAPVTLPVPTNLRIISNFNTIARLGWNAVSHPPGETFVRYQPRYKAVSESTWTNSGSTVGTTVWVVNLTVGVQYEFQVRAEYLSGNGDFAASVRWTAGTAATLPDASRFVPLLLDGLPVTLDDPGQAIGTEE